MKMNKEEVISRIKCMVNGDGSSGIHIDNQVDIGECICFVYGRRLYKDRTGDKVFFVLWKTGSGYWNYFTPKYEHISGFEKISEVLDAIEKVNQEQIKLEKIFNELGDNNED